MFQLSSKLKSLSRVVSEFNKTHYSDIKNRVQLAKEKLKETQLLISKGFHDLDLFNREKVLCTEYVCLRAVEESSCKQKYCIKWLSLGDHRTKYFHQIVKVRSSRNNIKLLISSNVSRLIDHMEIAAEAVNFYINLLGKIDLNMTGGDIGQLKQLLTYRVSVEQQSMLIKPVTPYEAKRTMWFMYSNKALGPDGLNVKLFKFAWSFVGLDFIHDILKFSKSSKVM